VAAGVWTPEVLGMLGVDLQVSARKGQIAIVAGAPITVHHKVMEASYMGTVANDETELQVAAVVEATRAGSILLGSSRLTTGPNDRGVDLDVLNRIVAKAVGLFPGLASGRVIRSYAGVRPLSPDHSPIIGPLPMAPRVVVATGHEGGGVMMGAATGDLVASLIGGRAAPVPLEPYLPGRFLSS
jgi:glycine/D-amino acid oxidase-like deaminating enzyme